MEKDAKFCVVCGKRIPELSYRRITCGPYCRSRKKSGYAPFLSCKKPPYDDLTVLQRKAQEAGMSYGKYMAVMYEREGR